MATVKTPLTEAWADIWNSIAKVQSNIDSLSPDNMAGLPKAERERMRELMDEVEDDARDILATMEDYKGILYNFDDDDDSD